MELREYLFRKKKHLKEFAEDIGYSRGHISAIMNGNTFPNQKITNVIYNATQGQVTKEDLMKAYEERFS